MSSGAVSQPALIPMVDSLVAALQAEVKNFRDARTKKAKLQYKGRLLEQAQRLVELSRKLLEKQNLKAAKKAVMDALVSGIDVSMDG